MKIRNGFVSNSSSSCFICNDDGTGKDYTVEEAMGILQEMVDFHNKTLKDDECDESFDEIFGDIYIGEKGFKGCLLGWEDYYNIDDTYGKLIISSCSDNTIPWYMQELIEEKFNARRLHLG
jgi:hypothetical protein